MGKVTLITELERVLRAQEEEQDNQKNGQTAPKKSFRERLQPQQRPRQYNQD